MSVAEQYIEELVLEELVLEELVLLVLADVVADPSAACVPFLCFVIERS